MHGRDVVADSDGLDGVQDARDHRPPHFRPLRPAFGRSVRVGGAEAHAAGTLLLLRRWLWLLLRGIQTRVGRTTTGFCRVEDAFQMALNVVHRVARVGHRPQMKTLEYHHILGQRA